MGLRQSRLDKSTSPYSSWGSSIDNLICGPGKICDDRWTPLPTRSNSLTTSFGQIQDEHKRSAQSQRRRARSSSGAVTADIYTLDRQSIKEGFSDIQHIYTEQPIPIDNDIIRTSLPESQLPYQSSHSRRHSYRPDVIPIESMPSYDTRLTQKKSKTNTRKRKIKKSSATSQPIQIFIDLNGHQQKLELDNENRGFVQIPRRGVQSRTRKKRHTKSLSPLRPAVSPEELLWQKHESSQMLPLNSKSPQVLKTYETINTMTTRSGSRNLSKTKRILKSNSQSSMSASLVTNNLNSSTRVVPPRNKVNELPPKPFRIRAVPDVPFPRISTAVPRINK